MITYNPKDWFALIFQFHRSDTFRILLPTMFLMGVITGGLVYGFQEGYLTWKSSTVFHQILGFVLSMLLVFRINTAYDRWWDGRKLWGSLINNSRSLAVKLHALLETSDRETLDLLLADLSRFAFALRDHLRGVPSAEARSAHYPLELYQRMNHALSKLQRGQKLTDSQLLFINPELTSLMDITGACERIKSSPIPFSYGLFLKKVIFVYVTTTPITFAREFGFWAVPAVVLVFYAFASLELISEEVEDPFGTDANDLPLDDLAEKIRKSILQVQGETQS
jgi:putative membrane protein